MTFPTCKNGLTHGFQAIHQQDAIPERQPSWILKINDFRNIVNAVIMLCKPENSIQFCDYNDTRIMS